MFRSTGYKSRKHKNTIEIIETIKYIYAINDFFTISDIKKYLENKRNIICSTELIRVIIKKELLLRYKKCKYEYFKNENKLKEQTYAHHIRMTRLMKKKRLIASIDEIGFTLKLNPIYAWSKKGIKKYIKNKLVDGKKSTSACITSNGDIYYKTIDNAFKTVTFFEFFKSLKFPKGTIITIDNASIHKSKIIKNYAIQQGWELIFIPPYSPCFNPIENVFSAVKHHFRLHKSIDEAFKVGANSSIIKNSIKRSLDKVLDITQIYSKS